MTQVGVCQLFNFWGLLKKGKYILLKKNWRKQLTNLYLHEEENTMARKADLEIIL